MIEMKHTSTKYGPMVVNVKGMNCSCTWDVKITAQDRMGGYEYFSNPEAGRIKSRALKSPKDWYRAAENVLLATGKVVTRKTMTPVGVTVSNLECKAHSGLFA